MYEILDTITCPADVKQLNINQLLKLAEEIRDFLIHSVSQTGGHLASNLGVVELTLALFKTLDLPQDKIIWDVGHQSYVHKLLSGRKGQFDSLRKFGGLSGFPKKSESEFDAYNTGHASTSISAALGMTKAAEIKGEKSLIIPVIGDGSLTGGMAFEALNDAGTYGKNFIVILNDNEMSIAKNVGGLSRYLTHMRTRPGYFCLKSFIERFFRRIPLIGLPLVRVTKKWKDTIRHLLTRNTVFEDLGFTYFGPVDGHDVSFLCYIIQRAQLIPGPVLIHVKTKKGKGYPFAEDKPTAFHGVGSFSVETGECVGGSPSYSSVFGDEMVLLGEKNDSLCAVTAAMPDGTGLKSFKNKFSDRFFDVGIAEQHAVTFAAGLSTAGLKPVFAVYSSFLQRAYDQVLHDVCFQNLDFVLCIDRAGLVGEDGETHQGIYDLAFLSHLPNMTILAPANFTELRQMMSYATEIHKGPVAIRYPRGAKECLYDSLTPFSLGEVDFVEAGEDVCIFSVGAMLDTAQKAAAIVKQEGYTVTIVNLRTVYPLNVNVLSQMAKKHKLLITIEDGVTTGGIGEHILSAVGKINPHVLVKGHQNGIVSHGTTELLYKVCGLDPETIADEIIQGLKQE